MANPIAVFTGDNHLRPTTWGKYPELFGDAYCSFQQIIDYCVESKLPLLQLGDLFDKARPDSLSVSHYIHGVNRLKDNGLMFCYISGNHDLADPPWGSITTHPVHAGKFEIEGVKFLGIDFTSSADIEATLAHYAADIYEADVVLAHQSWEEIQPLKASASLSQIPHGCTLLTGDYHVTMRVEARAGDNAQIVAFSPGSTCMQKLNEDPEKVFGVLHDDLTVTWQPLETRPFFAPDTLRNAEELDALIGVLSHKYMEYNISNAEIKKPILRVKYLDTIPSAYERLVAATGEHYFLFEEPQRGTVTEVVTIQNDSAFAGLQTAVTSLTQNKPKVGEAAVRLLQAADVDTVLNSIQQQFWEANTHGDGAAGATD